MADDKNWNFGRMDRVAIIALLVGLAGVIGPMFLPPDFIDYVPHGWRLGISLGSGIVIACGVLYLLWDFGQVFRIVRIVFYILVFVIVMGASIALFGGLALWLRGLLGATAGATLVIGLPYLYPDLRQVIQGSSVAESSAAVARLAELGWGVQPDDAGILFSIASKPLPPMKESADLF
jgi:hypothetical protein